MQSILKKRVETNIKCYVCDGALNEEKCLLLDSVTPYSKTSIPNKIGQLLGDQYVILVSPEDSICKSCYDLFKLLDELETRTQNVKNDIINHLIVKYHVISDDTQSDACAVKIETLPSASKSLKRKIDSAGELLNHEEIEQQLSQMFGSPIKITSVDRSKKRIQNYKCIYCKYQTNNIAEYKKHIGKCKRTNILKCSECNVIFNEHVLYRRHMKEVHYSRYKCLKCDLSFNSEAVLKNHLSQNICDVLVCKICKFQARTKEQYMEHIKTHSRPMFKCGVCYQRFESKAVLNNHVKTHRSTSFWCGICRKSFNQRDTLMLHLKSHTNTRSINIKMSSNSTSQIENSPETDNDKANNVKNESKQIEFFTCNNCQLTFLNELTYLQHMKTHNMKNEKPFKEEKIESNNSIDLESIIEKLHSDYEEVQKNDTSVDETQISEKPLENDTEMQHGNYSNSNESQQIENKVLLENISNAKDILENGNILVYKCGTCEKIYENSNDLQIHLLTDHNNIDSEIEIYQIQRNINDTNGLSVNDSDKSSNIEMSNSEGTVDGNSYILSNHDNMNGDNFESIAYINSNDNENVKYVTINSANGDESHILTSDDKEIQVLAYDPKMTDDLGQSIFVDSEGGKIQFVIIDSEMQNMITSNENTDDVNCENKIPEQSQDFSNTQNSDNSVINEFLQNAITTNDIALEQSEYLFHDGSKVKIIDNKKIEPSQQIIENSKNSTENHDFNLEDICDIKTESNNQVR